MGASFSFELLKLRKRPAVWTLWTTMLLVVALLGYLLSYVFIAGVDGNPSPEGERFLPSLYPENLVSSVLVNFVDVGGAVALTLGVLAVGSEYGWDTLKVVLTQRPGRIGVFVGKMAAVGVVLLVFVLSSFAFGAACSYAVANLLDAPVKWPPAGELLRGLGAGWLIVAAWGSLGAFLAALLRGTALAVGLGLAYALVLESVISGTASVSEGVEKVSHALLGRNSRDLAFSFEDSSGAATPPFGAVEPAQAALVLGAYVLIPLALATLLFWRRDAT